MHVVYNVLSMCIYVYYIPYVSMGRVFVDHTIHQSQHLGRNRLVELENEILRLLAETKALPETSEKKKKKKKKKLSSHVDISHPATCRAHFLMISASSTPSKSRRSSVPWTFLLNPAAIHSCYSYQQNIKDN